ncbi:unnamed protein product, partial [Allacma fusca]
MLDTINYSGVGSCELTQVLTTGDITRGELGYLPFYTFVKDIETVKVVSFPPEYDYYERKDFHLSKLQQNKVRVVERVRFKDVRKNLGIYYKTIVEDQKLMDTTVKDFVPDEVSYSCLPTPRQWSWSNVKEIDELIDTCVGKTFEYIPQIEFVVDSLRNLNPFHVRKLHSPLMYFPQIIARMGLPWNFLGTPESAAAFHIEDLSECSTMYHYFGSTKIFICIKRESTELFERNLRRILNVNSSCPAALRIYKPLVKLAVLEEWNVKYTVVFLNPGEQIFVASGIYHAVVNTGYNFATSVAYADGRWGIMDLKLCMCKKRQHGVEWHNVNQYLIYNHWSQYEDDQRRKLQLAPN